MKLTAAGILVFRNNNNNPQILGLVALPKHRKRSRGRYDIPKGRIDEGETAIEAAFRECAEECGLRPKIITDEPVTNGPLVIWLGEVDPTDEVVLGENPYTGEFEHEGFEWLTISKMKKNCLSYLRPFIINYERKIWDYLNVWKD